MPFIIMYKDTRVGILFGNENDVKYKILFENLPEAKKQGLDINMILHCNSNKAMPLWIRNRIPQSEPNKFDYLRRTEGRLATDDIWFEAV